MFYVIRNKNIALCNIPQPHITKSDRQNLMQKTTMTNVYYEI